MLPQNQLRAATPGPNDPIPEFSPSEKSAARQRIRKTEAVLDQIRQTRTPAQAAALELRRSRFQAVAVTLKEEPDCRLRLLAVQNSEQNQVKLTLQRQEPRDQRWHEMSLGPADAAALEAFAERLGLIPPELEHHQTRLAA